MKTKQALSQELPEVFQSFGKQSPTARVAPSNSPYVVAYTRVSDKEQEKNMSLPNQQQEITRYAERQNLIIEASFGGRYESASTDERKEFRRMLDYVQKQKGRISMILVYMTDRFSRTGAEAMLIAEKLRNRYGVHIQSVMQPTDTSNPFGAWQQDMQLMFSKYDNVTRRTRAVAGMRYKLERGIWVTPPPQGYSIVRVDGDKKILINEVGRQIQKAFRWKIEGYSNDEIIFKLRKLGVKMYRQQLSKIFQNVFYCGLLAHGLLEGKVVKGIQEPMITYEEFLHINDLMKMRGHYRSSHDRQNAELPLRVFCACGHCGQPMTGYVIKKKGLYYYKCRTKGCGFNQNASRFNEAFAEYCKQYQLNSTLLPALQYQMEYAYREQKQENEAREKLLRGQLTQLENKIRNIEESYFALRKMEEETYLRMSKEYNREREEILREIQNCGGNISNLSKVIQTVMSVSLNLHEIWASSEFHVKNGLQKLIFPQGITYDREKGSFRTGKVNEVFSLVAQFSKEVRSKKKGQTDHETDLSPAADP